MSDEISQKFWANEEAIQKPEEKESWVVFTMNGNIYSMICREEDIKKVPGDLVYLGKTDDTLWSLVKESRRARDEEDLYLAVSKLRKAIDALQNISSGKAGV